MNARPALKLFLFMTILTGLVYPLLITLIVQVAIPFQANGSLIRQGDRVVGSKLIAQNFQKEAYFWPRPSAIDYDPLKPSGGSNYGPTSKKLKEVIVERMKRYPGAVPSAIPSELLYASGSGLDPHISVKTAYYQADRVARARSLQNPAKLKELIDSLAEGFGKQYVNVLLLNQALDRA